MPGLDFGINNDTYNFNYKTMYVLFNLQTLNFMM